MITWEYRVFRESDGAYVIREVFYNDDGTLAGCTESTVEPVGKSLVELAKDIDSFKAALKLPILKLADIPNPAKRKRPKERRANLTAEQVRVELGLAKPSSHHQPAQQKSSPRPTLVTSGKERASRTPTRYRTKSPSR